MFLRRLVLYEYKQYFLIKGKKAEYYLENAPKIKQSHKTKCNSENPTS
jgi:hypothetical protein